MFGSWLTDYSGHVSDVVSMLCSPRTRWRTKKSTVVPRGKIVYNCWFVLYIALFMPSVSFNRYNKAHCYNFHWSDDLWAHYWSLQINIQCMACVYRNFCFLELPWTCLKKYIILLHFFRLCWHSLIFFSHAKYKLLLTKCDLQQVTHAYCFVVISTFRLHEHIFFTIDGEKKFWTPWKCN